MVEMEDIVEIGSRCSSQHNSRPLEDVRELSSHVDEFVVCREIWIQSSAIIWS